MTETGSILTEIETIIIAERLGVDEAPLRRQIDTMRQASQGVASGRPVDAFHDGLRGFVRLWSDAFARQQERMEPMIDPLFYLHGHPLHRSLPVRSC